MRPLSCFSSKSTLISILLGGNSRHSAWHYESNIIAPATTATKGEYLKIPPHDDSLNFVGIFIILVIAINVHIPHRIVQVVFFIVFITLTTLRVIIQPLH